MTTTRWTDGRVEVQSAAGTAGWVPNSYLAEHPDFLPAEQQQPTTTDGTVQPDSHSGCNVNACIDVRGTKLKVDHWYTSAEGGNGKCTTSYFDLYIPGHKTSDEPDTVIKGQYICSEPGVDGRFYDNETDPHGSYANHTHLCNIWTKIAGHPCAEVHT